MADENEWQEASDAASAEADAAAARLSEEELVELFTADRAAIYNELATDELLVALENEVPGLLAELDAAIADDLWRAYNDANAAEV